MSPRPFIEHTPVGLFQTDSEGRCLYVNRAWCEITGLAPADALGDGWFSALHPDDRDAVAATWQDAIRRGAPFSMEYRFRRPDGAVTWVFGQACAYRDEAGQTLYAGCITDLNRQKDAEELARERETRFRDVADHAPVMVGVTDAEGHITFLNKTWLVFRGRTLEEEEGWAWAEGLHPDDRERTLAMISACIARREPYSIEYRMQDRDGRYHWLLDTAIPRIDSDGRLLGYIGTAVTIDAQKQLEARLRRELREKETLLREIHHRVKNNLQVISGLVHFQSKQVAEPDRRAFAELRHRLHAMALVHEALYRSESLAEVNFTEYIGRLVSLLTASFGGLVTFSIQADRIFLSLDAALPAGMIVCELVTNVLKYAYRPGERGRGFITVERAGGTITVEVRDEGLGFPDAFDPARDARFGLVLVRSLLDQLGAESTFESAAGARVRFSFTTPTSPPCAADHGP